jgi:hypothetical protein
MRAMAGWSAGGSWRAWRGMFWRLESVKSREENNIEEPTARIKNKKKKEPIPK